MKNLLYKEFALALHPTSLMFLALSAMLMIPNYPYYVTFFYTTLGIFFISISGRENKDIFYTMLLPIRKKDIVSARFALVIVLEILQILTAAIFIFIKNLINMPENLVGIEANIAFIGLSLVMLGIFNLVFLTSYYKNPDKVGKAFILSNIAIWLYMIIAEVGVHICPIMKRLDVADFENLTYKLPFFAGGIIFYILLTFISYRISVKRFEALDF